MDDSIEGSMNEQDELHLLRKLAEEVAIFSVWLEAGIWQGHEDNVLDALQSAGYDEKRIAALFRSAYPFEETT
jgi:hypothetical protein